MNNLEVTTEKLVNLSIEDISKEPQSSKTVKKQAAKPYYGYATFNNGKSLQGLSDVKVTQLVMKRIPDSTYNTIDVKPCTHIFDQKNLKSRKITLIREFDWNESTINFATLRFMPAFIKEQLFGEESKEAKDQLQTASYHYRRLQFWISEDCQHVDLSMDNYSRLDT